MCEAIEQRLERRKDERSDVASSYRFPVSGFQLPVSSNGSRSWQLYVGLRSAVSLVHVSSGAIESEPVSVYCMVNQNDDRQLVEQAQAGDLPAFDQLVLRHQGSLYCYLYRMCRNGAEAEEMTQEAFVKAWEGLHGFRGAASFKTWLYRIATNLCINRLSRRKPVEPLTEEIPAARQNEPEESFRQRVLSECITRALEGLPADQRSALVLSIYEELSHDEIAEAMGRSQASVNMLLYRARTGVRRSLAEARTRGLI